MSKKIFMFKPGDLIQTICPVYIHYPGFWCDKNEILFIVKVIITDKEKGFHCLHKGKFICFFEYSKPQEEFQEVLRKLKLVS